MSAFLGAILAAGGSLPSGHLYAAVMNHFDIQLYDALVSKMVQLGYITRAHSHLLTATEKGKAFEKDMENPVDKSQTEAIVQNEPTPSEPSH